MGSEGRDQKVGSEGRDSSRWDIGRGGSQMGRIPRHSDDESNWDLSNGMLRNWVTHWDPMVRCWILAVRDSDPGSEWFDPSGEGFGSKR